MNCAFCKQHPKNRCNAEGYDCLKGKIDLSPYEAPENRPLHDFSDASRRTHGNSLSRIEEIIEFSKSSGYQRLGLAFCVGLAGEARLVAKIFKQHFKVFSVCCKVSGINKDEHGLTKIKDDRFEVACNPIGQAQILNKSKTELNIQLGLCLGHDMLLQKYAQAPVTVLAVKDRALANNPLGAVYSSYWLNKFKVSADE